MAKVLPDWFRLRGRRPLAALATTATILLVPALSLAFDDDAKPKGKAKAEVTEAKVKPKKAAKAKAKQEAEEKAASGMSPEELARTRELAVAVRDLSLALAKSNAAERSKPAEPMPSRPGKSVTPPSIDSAALDAMLDKGLVAAKTVVSPQTTDEEFVRRAYLDLTGKLPTIEEVRTFAISKEKDRRAKLIDKLLSSPAYADNWARYWRDVVFYRAPNANPRLVGYPLLEDWLAEQFAKNRPWDEIATEVITATGSNVENGATAFTVAQEAQPVELAGEVSRIFMGVQIHCAQCHDHPSDIWKRQQFHEFAAFFSGIQSRRNGQTQPPTFTVRNLPNAPRYAMPDLKDPQKSIPITPKFFLGDAKPVPTSLKAEQRRTLVASYITGQDNPWFAKAFVNRAWYALMGETFYNPIDDLGPTRTANSPEVIEALASQWQQGGYDIKWLFRTIMNTKAYQRESRSTNTQSGRTPFASNCPSRLRSDQIFDALAHALDLSPENMVPNRAARRMAAAKGAKAQAEAAKADKADEKSAGKADAVFRKNALRNGPRFQFNSTFGVDPSVSHDDVMGTIPQALFMMNSPIINRSVQANPSTMLGELLMSTPDNRAALDALYLKVLARRPNAKEVVVCGKYLEGVPNRREAFEDILWSLINSTEFISRR